MKNKRVAFIGSGNMAEALIKGLVRSGLLEASSITACDRDPARLEHLAKTYGVGTSKKNGEGARSAGVLIVAVKPANVQDALESIRASVDPSKLVLSIAAGVKLSSLETALGEGVPVIRAMPNGPALAGCGMSAVCGGSSVSVDGMEEAKALLGAVGDVIEVEEGMMDAVTAVSGSGPAYFFYLVEALENAAVAAGFSPAVARRLAVKTAAGSMSWLEETGSSPEELRIKVMSPGGTTEAAIGFLEERDFTGLVAGAVEAAIARSRELGGD